MAVGDMEEARVGGGLPPVSLEEQARLLGPVLKGTSRAFYLTLRVLPGNLRTPVGLAYLLGRTADTIADTKTASPRDRLTALLDFRRQVDGPGDVGEIETLARSVRVGSSPKSEEAERELIMSMPKVISMLEGLGEMDRFRVRQVVVTLTQGMEMDLTYFRQEGVSGLETTEQLDEYTYLVAGCVGQFWTEMSMDHNPGLGGWDAREMSEKGVRFGKALQLTNILRDVPKDLRLGRCYLPREVLEGCGLSAGDLLDARAIAKARPALVWGINRALAHYRAAAEYLRAIPVRHYRLRLAVSWPLLMGLGTLAELAKNGEWLDPSSRSKVSRGWVYRMMGVSGVRVLSNRSIAGWVERLRGEILRAL